MSHLWRLPARQTQTKPPFADQPPPASIGIRHPRNLRLPALHLRITGERGLRHDAQRLVQVAPIFNAWQSNICAESISGMTFGPAAIMAEMLPAPDASSTANSASTARSRCSLDRLDSHPVQLLKVTELLATSSTLSNRRRNCQEKKCRMTSRRI